MKYSGILIVTLTIAIAVSSSGCNKDCYNPSLEHEYLSKVCPADCPGVTGCDGKTIATNVKQIKKGVAVKN